MRQLLPYAVAVESTSRFCSNNHTFKRILIETKRNLHINTISGGCDFKKLVNKFCSNEEIKLNRRCVRPIVWNNRSVGTIDI